jgi:hypothetical protein
MPRSPAVADYGGYFSGDYATARARFREAALAAGFELSAYPIGARGPDGSELTMDVARRGAGERALVVSSGLHGIEGYFGSAVQCAWLSINGQRAVEGVRTVFVHALNPYGFAFRRRVNEENVDLNRNFMLPGQPFSGAHDAYHELAELLNPHSPPGRIDTLLLAALAPIARHGFGALKNAIAQGQYEYPFGLFYGGREPTRTQRILEQHIASWVGAASRVLHVDLHSGRGKFGTYALCADMPVASARFADLQRIFGVKAVEGFDASGVLYEVRGGLGAWLAARFQPARYDCVLAEFGTYSGLRVLSALRNENRAHHYAPADSPRRERAKRQLFEAFCPRSPRWRTQVVDSALGVLDRAFDELAH